MYNKVKKALENMAYTFSEAESMRFKNGVKLSEGFQVEKTYQERVYVEIAKNGDIEVWNGLTGEHLFTIRKKETYLMMFELGWVLNN